MQAWERRLAINPFCRSIKESMFFDQANHFFLVILILQSDCSNRAHFESLKRTLVSCRIHVVFMSFSTKAVLRCKQLQTSVNQIAACLSGRLSSDGINFKTSHSKGLRPVSVPSYKDMLIPITTNTSKKTECPNYCKKSVASTCLGIPFPGHLLGIARVCLRPRPVSRRCSWAAFSWLPFPDKKCFRALNRVTFETSK